MIKQITIKNVKGQTTSQELTGKDIIIGRNGAGKTTRLQSIGLAMLGYVPGKGKTAADTFKLASDDEMTVGIDTDAFSFTRSFAKSKKLAKDGTMDVKISQKISVSPSMGETTNAQKEQRIRQEMGDFPVMLDFGAFVGMTDNQKRDFIYGLSGNALTWDRKRVEEELRFSLLSPALKENSPEMYECMEKCIEESMAQYKEGTDIQSGILAMSEYAKDRLKYWKKEKIDADGAARKLTELKNKGVDTDRDLLENQKRLRELQAEKERLIKDLAELGAKNASLTVKETELETLRTEITKLEDAPDAGYMTELEDTIKQLIDEIAELERTDKVLEEEEDSNRNTMASIESQMNESSETMSGAKEQLANINAVIKANGDLLQRIADSHGCCAFSRNIPCTQDFSGFIRETNAYLDTQYEKKDECEELVNITAEAINQQKGLLEAAKIARNILQDKKKENKRLKDAKTKELEQKNSELSELKGREPVLALKRQQEAEIASFLNENPKVDLTAMEDQKILTAGQIESLTATIKEQEKIRQEIIYIKSNILDSQTAEFNVVCWNRMNDAIGQRGIKGSIVKEMLDPLKEDVTSKLHEIGIHQGFFFLTNSDTGKEIFEFGWGGRAFDALSTGEQLLLMTALMTAIIERAEPPVKVLALDNINDLDRYNLRLVMRGLKTIGKNMDNIILAGVVEPTEEDSEGWKVWNL